MSWSGFKKNVGRATTQVMMKTGHVERTSNREYEVEERRYRTLESASLRLQKEARGYLDSLRAMTASQMRIAETIDAFYGDSGASDGVSRSYKQAVEDLDAETVKALDGPYRCVPPDLRKYAWDGEKGVEDVEVLRQVEWELNQGGKERLAGIMRADLDAYGELMDYIYRTTVLEPINRFCAYFPDINECIKKRQHKMLDYDAMRSKVKKLTEKPDKDPGKLPRTEKETEMVSLSQFLTSTHPAERSKASSVPPRKSVGSGSGRSARSAETTDTDLAVPSPPKALNGIRERLGMVPAEDAAETETGDAKETGTGLDHAEESEERRKSGDRGRQRDRSVRRTSSVWSRYSSMLSPRLAAETEEAIAQGEKPPAGFERSSPRSLEKPRSLRSLQPSPNALDPKKKAPKSRTKSTKDQPSPTSLPELTSLITYPQFAQPISRKPVPSTRSPSIFSGSSGSSPSKHRSPAASTRGPSKNPAASSSAVSLTNPWFAPGELEEIMRPVKQAFMMKQTDDLKQAKAAYEQLNDQLTNELPQLIDLRVPYLDPSFEALVKIQLRFCAEAYSRMAQVQQYLDASTRDQYANGDLDARVEDVLGQIRELSIAGTV